MNKPSTPTIPWESRAERLWEEFLANSPTPDQFISLARSVNYFTERALEKYVATNPDRNSFSSVLFDGSNNHICSSLIPLLLARYPEASIFRRIMSKFWNDKELASQAYIQAVGLQNVDQGDLSLIIREVRSQQLIEQVAGELMRRGPTDDSMLCLIMAHSKMFAEKAAEIALGKDIPSNEELQVLVRRVPSKIGAVMDIVRKNPSQHLYLLMTLLSCEDQVTRLEVANLILAQEIPDNSAFNFMFDIATHVPSLREKVWKRWGGIELSHNQLFAIARDIPELSERARVKMVPEPRNAGVILSEIQSTAFGH